MRPASDLLPDHVIVHTLAPLAPDNDFVLAQLGLPAEALDAEGRAAIPPA